MTKKFKLLTLFLTFGVKLFAQNSTQEKDRNRLMYLNSLYLQSYIHSDTTTFNKLLWAEEFTQTNPNGSVVTREQNAINFGKLRYDKILYFYGDNIKITFLKDDLAEIYARNPSGFLIDGKLEESISWYKDTYQKKSGEWKCIAAVIKNNPF